LPLKFLRPMVRFSRGCFEFCIEKLSSKIMWVGVDNRCENGFEVFYNFKSVPHIKCIHQRHVRLAYVLVLHHTRDVPCTLPYSKTSVPRAAFEYAFSSTNRLTTLLNTRPSPFCNCSSADNSIDFNRCQTIFRCWRSCKQGPNCCKPKPLVGSISNKRTRLDANSPVCLFPTTLVILLRSRFDSIYDKSTSKSGYRTQVHGMRPTHGYSSSPW
jgi:hypothetical protein